MKAKAKYRMTLKINNTVDDNEGEVEDDLKHK